MKKLTILFLILFAQNGAFSQTNINTYPFSVEIKGQGKPILFIPGLSCSGSVWKQSSDSLKSKYQCHILTLAGFDGQKPIDLENGYIKKIIQGITNYIAHELSEKPIIIGHSLGGFISLSLACSHPDVLSQLIIVDAYPHIASAFNSNITKEVISSQAKQLKDVVLNSADSVFYLQETIKVKSMISDEQNIQMAIGWLKKSDRETIAQSTFEIMTTDLRNEIENVKIPILVLGTWIGLKDYGITKDIANSSYKQQFSRASDCQIEVADNAKHFIMWDDPKWFYEKIKSFISHE